MTQQLHAASGPRDDRGNPVTLLTLSDLKRAEQDPGGRKAALARHLKSSIRAENKRFDWGRFGISLAIFITIVVVFTVTSVFWRVLQNFGCIAYLVAAVVVTVVMRRWVVREVGHELAVTAVAEGVCGSCAYSLSSVPTEADGCVVCPECGAAWKASRIVRPHWKSAAGVALYQPPWWKLAFLGFPRSKDQLAPDDRGRFVRVLDSHLRLLAPARREEWGEVLLGRVRASSRRIGRLWRILVAILPALGAAGVAAIAVMVWKNEGGRDPSVFYAIGGLAFFAIVLLAIAMGIYSSRHFAGPRKVIPVFRAWGICGCCGRGLRDLAAESDGLIVCPDCSAAWRITAAQANPSVPSAPPPPAQTAGPQG